MKTKRRTHNKSLSSPKDKEAVSKRKKLLKQNTFITQIYEVLNKLRNRGHTSVSMRELERILKVGCYDKNRILIVELKYQHCEGNIVLPQHIIEHGIRGFEQNPNFQILLINKTKVLRVPSKGLNKKVEHVGI